MKRTVLLIGCLVIFLSSGFPAAAQSFSSGAAVGIPVNTKVVDGDIITSSSHGYQLSTSPYDSQVFGVVSLHPALYFKNNTAQNNVPVISNGEVRVRVSSINGNITAGDFITSSTIPGVGEKASDNGYVLGRAEQSYASNNSQKVGIILLTMQPHFAQITNNLTHNIYSSFTLGITDAISSPLGVIRYFVAGIITLLSFYFGFRFFGRASNRGVEAIGRNPLAKQAILVSIFINTIITIAIMFFGVAISYLILVL